MTEARRWLDTRTPPPPEELRPRVEAVVETVDEEIEAVLENEAVELLGRALGRPGRERESAFDLLLADALATYACEAALEDDAADVLLARLATRLLGAEAVV